MDGLNADVVALALTYQNLPSVMRGLDTQFLPEGIDSEAEATLAPIVNADLVKGRYSENQHASAKQEAVG